MVEQTDNVVDQSARDRSPERTCIVTREVGPPSAMLRFVLDPAGAVVADVACCLPGRGVWVTATRPMVDRAFFTKAFQRAFKKPVVVRTDLGQWVDQLLERRALERLSLANKAGRVVAGFTRVEALVGSGKAHVLVHATDGAADGIGKLDRLFRAVANEYGKTARIFFAFESTQLGLALGRSSVIHAALESSGATASFVEDLARLKAFRTTETETTAATAPDSSVVLKG